MDKVIATILLVVASTICSVVVFNAVYPAINSSSNTLVAQSSQLSDKVKSKIEIINVVDEGSSVYVWIKNIGLSKIDGLERADIFFGPKDSFSRIAYGGSVTPYWDYYLENADDWTTSATLRITIHEGASLSSGTYYVKMVIPNGISDSAFFST
jgi:hypothetical protein